MEVSEWNMELIIYKFFLTEFLYGEWNLLSKLQKLYYKNGAFALCTIFHLLPYIILVTPKYIQHSPGAKKNLLRTV